jgi:hypothetical protein
MGHVSSLHIKESDLAFELDAFPLVLVRVPRTFAEHLPMQRGTSELTIGGPRA